MPFLEFKHDDIFEGHYIPKKDYHWTKITDDNTDDFTLEGFSSMEHEIGILIDKIKRLNPIIIIIIIALFVAFIPELIIVGIWGIVIALIIRLFSKTDKTPIWKAGLENWYYVYKKLF